MSVNLDKNRSTIVAAWKDVVDDKTNTNWALYGYEAQSNDLKVVETGDGGLEELCEELNSGKIMYAFVRVNDPKTSLTKYLLINWQGEGAPTVRKGTCANHIRDISKLLSGAHLTINARTEDDVEVDRIMDKLSSVGSAYSFKEPRQYQEEQKGPVGTNYSRVIPAKEINVKDRDNFWKKEEEEERRRVEMERERRQQELIRAEAERRAREEKEHIERERRIVTSELKSPTINTGPDYSIPSPLSPIQSQLSPTRSMTHAEEMRQQRNNEARQLIGSRVGTAKAIFTQNTASGQMQTIVNKSAPVKPVRNSIAQRINSLNNPETQNVNKDTESGVISAVSAVIVEEHINLSNKENIQNVHENYENEASSGKLTQQQTSHENIRQNEPYEDDGDQYSTIKRSPYSKTNNGSQGNTPVDTEPPQQFQDQYEDRSKLNLIDQNDTVTEEDIIYQDVMSDGGLKARALYDYQAADESEITFDPGDIITHIDQIDEGWWQGLGPNGSYGLFPANYVELIQ